MRRHVFYIHGFDPRGPAPYHAMSSAAAKSNGFSITPRRKAGPISSQWDLKGPQADVVYEFLRYDDWVRELWPRWNGHRRHIAAVRALLGYAQAGVVNDLARHARPALFALTAQAMNSLTPFALGLAFACAGWTVSEAALSGLAALAGPFAGLLAIPIWRAADARFNAAWFTRGLANLLESGRGEIQGRAVRVNLFAERLIEVWRGGTADEIVVVGHSAGSVLAVETLAQALQAAPDIAGARLRLLTLGQSIPTYAKLDRSGAFRLKSAAVAAAFRWIDVTSAKDPASSGATPLPGEKSVERLPTEHIDRSVSRLARTLDPLEFHFLYLRAQDPSQGFDYLNYLLSPESEEENLRRAA